MRPEINIFILDGPLQTLDKDVVPPRAIAVHADSVDVMPLHQANRIVGKIFLHMLIDITLSTMNINKPCIQPTGSIQGSPSV